MTAPARISQIDMERATKAVRNAGYERARFLFDFANQRIEVIVGSADTAPDSAQALADEWSDEDV